MGNESACECVSRLSSPLHRANLAPRVERGIREETQKPGKALCRLTSKINTKKETQKEKEGKGKNLQSCGKKKKEKIGGGGFRDGAVFVGGRG